MLPPIGKLHLRWPSPALWGLVIALLGAVGCAVHQTGHKPPVEPPGSFSRTGDAPVPDRWWRAFDDSVLNRLQRRALKGNFDLKAARDRLREARAVVRRESAPLYPLLDLSVTAERIVQEGTNSQTSDQLAGDLIAQYEVDLWKRIDSQVRRAEQQRQASREDLEAAAITLTANVASTWYALVQQRGQRAILEKQIETNKTVLKLVRARFAKGVVRASDVLRQQRLLESTREQLETVRPQIETLEHQLQVLTGRPPTRSLHAAGRELPELPAKPQTGLPSQLVHRRPDVRAAFHRVRAADRSVAVAIADQYPRLTLSVSASVADDDATDLFDDWIRTLAADAVTPVFDAGQRKAEVERAKAVKARRLDRYGQTVLTAFREVTDALSRESHFRKQIRLIEKQLTLAQRTFERLRREYLNGDISYIDVLDALTRQQQLQRDLLSTRFQLINNRIALYRALAGGWDGIAPRPDGEKQRADRAEPTSEPESS